MMALWVVVGHTFASMPMIHRKLPPALMNTYAVDVFIMLSGFVIFFMMNNKKLTYLVFITQRLFRIFPIYLFALIVSLLLIPYTEQSLHLLTSSPSTIRRLEIIAHFYEHPIFHFLSHILLLQGLVPNSVANDGAYTILGQSWSVSLEWQFYLIAPLLFIALCSLDNKRNILILTITSAFLIIIGMFLTGGFIGGKLGMFSIGFLSFFFYKDYASKLSASELMCLYFIISILSLSILKMDAIPMLIWFTTFYFVLLKQNENNNSLVSRLLDSTPILYLGKISYSIYMLHMIVLYFSMRLSMYCGFSKGMNYFLIPMITIFITIIVSTITYYIIENPMIKFGKKITQKNEI
ncbi:peptidoglycan/LPS O-acetylase OafA/YrhL [Sodalis ligni]|uniref:Peptidoglycan/LPS O-acetylase OafA/YrhL n=2 Tax=Sodalis ligni TaxID=2697027 RepID=A0A4R1N5K7_9GAMM|nr:peptidoglycan/LPS O-acetylase OafA/YrhL [Sodalis ligni]